MPQRARKIAFWIVVVLLGLTILPVVAASAAALSGNLIGNNVVGASLLALIEFPGGPASVVQKIVIPLTGFVSLAVLWRGKSKPALLLIAICLLGLLTCLFLWLYLIDADRAADLWQEGSTGLNDTNFRDAMTGYLVTIAVLLGVNILLVFGLKGAEILKSGGGGGQDAIPD